MHSYILSLLRSEESLLNARSLCELYLAVLQTLSLLCSVCDYLHTTGWCCHTYRYIICVLHLVIDIHSRLCCVCMMTPSFTCKKYVSLVLVWCTWLSRLTRGGTTRVRRTEWRTGQPSPASSPMELRPWPRRLAGLLKLTIAGGRFTLSSMYIIIIVGYILVWLSMAHVLTNM